MRKKLLSIALVSFIATPVMADEALLSITFDDATQSQLTLGLKVMSEFDLVGTLYVSTAGVEEASTTPAVVHQFMTWAGVNAFKQLGWEIGAHTHSHPRLTELTPVQVANELSRSNDLIIQHTGVSPVSFASPFGDYNDEVVDTVMKHYQTNALAWGGNEGRNTRENFSTGALGRLDVSWDVSTTAADVCNLIQQAADEKQWLVLAFHQIVEGEAEQYQTSVDNFRKMMYCASRLQREGVLRVVTIKDGAELFDAEKANSKEGI